MLKIGDFSKLAHVTVKTLRHYARVGLIKPDWIDRFTGYRYYILQQLPRLNRILALKELGFSLEQIASLIDEDVSVEQMRGMLKRKQSELEAHLNAAQKRLAMVAARLQQIEQAGVYPGGAVTTKPISAMAVASVDEVIPDIESLPERVTALIAELNDWMACSGVHAQGPWMALYPAAAYAERHIPVRLAVAVDPALLHGAKPVTPRVRLHVLPPVAEMACLVHTGPTATLNQAYTELFAWMEANHRRPAGPARELYLRDLSEAGQMTPWGYGLAVEVQLPVEPFASSNGSTNQSQTEVSMDIKFINRPAFNVVGLCYHGDNKNQEISVMWGEFNKRGGEVEAIAVPHTLAYGVCDMVEGLPEGHFEYVAGLEAPDGAPVPTGMVMRRIPAQKYAIFEHHGALAGLHNTYQRIHNEWIPQAGLEVVQPGLDMEVYTDEFKDFAPDSVFYIYVPVK